MTTATTTRVFRHLHEQAAAAPGRVDRAHGVIRDVRVLGQTSQNSRRYLPEAIRKALKLYEGAPVRIDHPADTNRTRPTTDTFGWLRRCRIGDDGAIYADLHFIRSHPLAEFVCETAERNPALLGLSHNANGAGHDEDGVYVVSEITDLRSVDLVSEPATSRSLFESADRRPTRERTRRMYGARNSREFTEAITGRRSAGARRLSERLQGRRSLREGEPVPDEDDDDLDAGGDGEPLTPNPPEDLLGAPDAEVEPVDVDAGDMGAWKSDVTAAIGKLAASGREADHALAMQLLKLMAPGKSKQDAAESLSRLRVRLRKRGVCRRVLERLHR